MLRSRAVWWGPLVACALLWPTPAATRAADATLAATWRTADIAVDGSIADWSGLERIDDGPMVAVQNDDGALYLAVASDDATVRLQLATGLIVWLDGSGRKVQTFGVRLEGLTHRPLPGATPDADASGDLPRGASYNTFDEFDLLGPAKNQRRLIDRPGDVGIALASGVENQSVVYELKLPLGKTDATPYAVGAAPAATMAIGLETPADPKPPRHRAGLDDPMMANPWAIDPYYGGYFNPPPPTNSADKDSKPKVIKPMKLMWISVRLAAAP